MLFNSGVFLQFFAAFLLLFWLVRNHLPARNLLIVAASYLFYGWWDWRFLFLLLFSSAFDFGVGLGLDRVRHPRDRLRLLVASVTVNLGILGFFKYYDFFAESLTGLLARLQIPFHASTLGIVLPVGISFYTFQSMSYALEVYRGHLKPTRSLVNFLAYVSFFPQLVAGPIGRANYLLPQFERTVVITAAMLEEGIWLMIWGLFKKVVVADNLAPLVEMVYGGPSSTALAVALGTLAFAFQIYADFSGYSDIARGSARLLGFDLRRNFDLPYASSSLREFWRRWHISLSTWLRDYLYISLGGNRCGAGRTYAHLLLTMLLGGLWHGAAWNFVLWGMWHGGGLAVERAWAEGWGRSPRVDAPAGSKSDPGPLRRAVGWLLTFLFVLYGWLLFRARSPGHILALTRSLGDFSVPAWTGSFLVNLAAFVAPLMVIEFWQLFKGTPLVTLGLPTIGKAGLQGLMLTCILLFWERKEVAFIYFQF